MEYKGELAGFITLSDDEFYEAMRATIDYKKIIKEAKLEVEKMFAPSRLPKFENSEGLKRRLK